MCIIVLIDAQLGIDRPPPIVYYSFINATSITVEEEEGLAEHAKCPVGLDYVRGESRSLLRNPTAIDEFNQTARYFGCCPPGTRGCVRETFGVIIECCPPDQICCVTETGKSFGCAYTYSQCCEGVVCPVGYGCCSASQTAINGTDAITGTALCCPIPSNVTDPDDFSLYCEIDTNVPPDYGDYDVTAYTGCLISHAVTLPWCPMPIPSYTNCTMNPNSTNYCANETIRCPSTSDCVYLPDPILATFNNSGTLVEFNVSLAMGCCPSGTTPCWGDDGVTFSGCINPALNETCCGSHICSTGSRCCTANYTTTQEVYDSALDIYIEVPVNATRYLGCCPSLLECCQADVTNPFFRDNTVNYFFCGKPYLSQSCAVDMTREGFWYELFNAYVSGLNDN